MGQRGSVDPAVGGNEVAQSPLSRAPVCLEPAPALSGPLLEMSVLPSLVSWDTELELQGY